MLAILIVMGIAFLLQGLFGFLQMKHLTNEFLKLRRKGKVAFGRKSGGFRAGAVVMFLIDDDGIVQEAKKLEGTTAFARVKPLEGFEGRYIGSLTQADGPDRHKNLCKAIEDAALTYRKYAAGETIEETPTPGLLAKTELAVGSLLDKTRKKAAVR
jgi:DNA-binding transcriptional regulator of glucitol operon